ncbi:GNAT family N-acetyltransferase [bacterium]|nr:GNAT family N-acetyltransferase [bacterium]
MLRVIRDIDALELMYVQWLALWDAVQLSSIYNHPDWYLSFIKANPDTSFFILTYWDGDSLQFVWPMQLQKDTVTHLTAPWADYAGPSIAVDFSVSNCVSTCLEWLKNQRYNKISLEEFRSDDAVPAMLAKMAAQYGFHPVLEEGVPCPRMDRNIDDDILVKKFVKSKNQKNVLRKLKKRGDIEFEHIKGKDEVLSYLPELFGMHTARWADVGETIFMDIGVRNFYINFIRAFPEDYINLTILRLNGTLVAINLDFCLDHALFMYKQTFDMALWKASLGLVNVIFTGRDLIERDFQLMDFSRGGDEWKLRLANEIRHNQNVVLLGSLQARLTFSLINWAKVHLITNPRKRQQVKQLIANFRSGLSKYGLAGLFGHFAQRFIDEKIKKRTILLFNIASCEAAATEHGLEHRLAAASDLFELCEMADPIDKAAYVKEMYARLRRGDICFLASSHGDIGCAIWVTYTDILVFPEITREWKLDEITPYIFDARTVKAQRGKGLFVQTLSALNDYLLNKQNSHEIFMACLDTNIPSKRGMERVGYKLTEEVKQL